MKVSELRTGQGKIDIEAAVIEKSSVREFDKFGKKGKVCDVKIRDDTGTIKLTLWNEQVDSVNIGNKIKVTNGYVSEFRGEKQLSTGKFGTLEVLDTSGEDHGEHILTKDERQEAEALNEEFSEPAVEEAVTGDELEESEIEGAKPKKEGEKQQDTEPKRPAFEEDDFDDNLDMDEERID